MNRRNRIVLVSLTLLLVAGLGAVALRTLVRPPPPESRDLRVAVRVEAPERDTAWTLLSYRGTLEGDRDATLSFRMGGEVARVHAREGEKVSAGDLLAELDVSELEAALARVRAELERARAQEAHWEGELEVDARLLEAGAVSRSGLEATRLSHRSALLAREGADAAVAEIEARRTGARIRAPQPGTVTRVEVAEGEGVLPGQSVLTLSGGERRVRVEVLERDRTRGIEPGTPASLGDERCPGRVTRVDAGARPPFGAIRVHVAPEGSCLEGRAPGTSVAVTFHLAGPADALFVPLSAVDFRGGTPRTFRITAEERAEAVPVTLGSQRGELQQVEGDLDSRDRVVVAGVTNLRPGDRVRVVEAPSGEVP